MTKQDKTKGTEQSVATSGQTVSMQDPEKVLLRTLERQSLNFPQKNSPNFLHTTALFIMFLIALVFGGEHCEKHNVGESTVLEQSGNISNVGYNAHVKKTTYNGISNSTKATDSGNVVNDDAALAITQNPHDGERAGIQQNFHNTDVFISRPQTLKDTLAGIGEKIAEIKNSAAETLSDAISPLALSLEDVLASIVEKVAKMKKLDLEITSGGYSDSEPAKELRAAVGELKNDVEGLENVYSKVGDMLANFKKELAAILSTETFLLGVQERVEEVTTNMEYELGDISSVAEHMSNLNMALELGVFSVSRIREEAQQALRAQANLEPDRVLHLLKGVIEQDTAEGTEQAATISGQTVLMQDPEKV